MVMTEAVAVAVAVVMRGGNDSGSPWRRYYHYATTRTRHSKASDSAQNTLAERGPGGDSVHGWCHTLIFISLDLSENQCMAENKVEFSRISGRRTDV